MGKIDLVGMMLEYGYSFKEIDKIINDATTFNFDKNRLGLMIYNSYRYLVAKGYSLNEIKKMSLSYPGNLYVSDKKRMEMEKIFLELGMSLEEFRKFSLKCVNIYAYSKERVCSYIGFFRNLGYEDRDIKKIFMLSPMIFRSSVSNLDKLYNDMLNYGFSMEEIFNIGKNFCSLWSHNFDKIMDIINTFISLGFNRDEIKEIIVRDPSLIGYGVDTICDKYNRIIDLGIDKDEINGVTIEYPSIINSDTQRTEKIINFFSNIGLRKKIIDDPKNIFIQSVEVSYARYCYYMDSGIEINEDNYKKLFFGWQYFKKVTGISKEELLEMYKYEDDVRGLVRKK